MQEFVHFDGKLIPRTEARVSVLDYGFLFGYGLYETIRAYNGKVFRLDAHLLRLDASAKSIGIKLDIAALRQAVLDTVKANGFLDTRVRITVSAGEGTMTPNLASCERPTFIVLAGEYHPFAAEKYEKGFNVVVSPVRRNSRSPVTFMKSANSMENMLARQQAKNAGADEALFLNERNYVTEASGSNVFIVADGVVVTPRLKSGILPGVTREALFGVVGQANLKVLEANVRLRQLLAAEEVFLTNSLIEVMPITAVDGEAIGGGKVGPVTKKLMYAYRQLVASELRAR